MIDSYSFCQESSVFSLTYTEQKQKLLSSIQDVCTMDQDTITVALVQTSYVYRNYNNAF